MTLDLVLIGLGIALDPLPLTPFMVVLGSKRGARRGAAFVFGWLVPLAIVVTVTVLATGNSPPKSGTAPSVAALAVRIAIGVFLIMVVVRHLRRRGRPKEPKKPPKRQEHADNMSPWFALGLAPTLQPWALIELGSKIGALIGLGIEGEEGAAAGAELGAEEAAAKGIHQFEGAEEWDVLADIPDDSAAALILLEHHWAVPLRDAVFRADGFRISDGFISPLDLVTIGMMSAEEARELHAMETSGAATGDGRQ